MGTSGYVCLLRYRTWKSPKRLSLNTCGGRFPLTYVRSHTASEKSLRLLKKFVLTEALIFSLRKKKLKIYCQKCVFGSSPREGCLTRAGWENASFSTHLWWVLFSCYAISLLLVTCFLKQHLIECTYKLRFGHSRFNYTFKMIFSN